MADEACTRPDHIPSPLAVVALMTKDMIQTIIIVSSLAIMVSLSIGLLLASAARWIKDHERRLSERGLVDPYVEPFADSYGDAPDIRVHAVGDRDNG